MRNLILTLGFMFATTSAMAEAPTCLKTRTLGRETCRQDAAVAELDGGTHFLAWGGKDSRGCDQCSRMVVGNGTGGVYDQTGRMIDTISQENSPGPRFGAQALWTGAAFFVWGGTVRQNERWAGDHYEVVSSVAATRGAFYVPGSRLWIRMTAEGAPANDGRLSLTDEGKVQICDAAGCRAFDMTSNSWSAQL